jgi:hypothetical protein
MSQRLLCLVLVSVAGAGTARSQAPPPDEFAAYSDRRRDAKIDVKDLFDAEVKDVVYLPQGWSPAESMRFYRLAQGSKLIPYSWFLHLEQAKDGTPFSSPENMNRFRYLPMNTNDHNPDGLPIGFVREPMQKGDPLKTDWLGLTCAACHTAEIRHNNTAYRIDGAPALADHDTFLIELTAAMKATVDDTPKFERFAKKVLGDNADGAEKAKLNRDLTAQFEHRHEYNQRNKTTVAYGYARLDAFGRILNEVLVRHIQVNDPKQARSPNAPVSYPFLWGITKHDVVQWNGIASNTKVEIGPLGRNVGEVLGVYGEVEVTPFKINDPDIGFESSVRFRNLIRLEDTIDTLQAPRWPEAFGKLDDAKVKAGSALFKKHCLSCHDPDDKIGNYVKTALTPISLLKTDEWMAKNFAERVGKVGNMKGRLTRQKRLGVDIDTFEGEAPGGALLIGVVGRTILGADPSEFDVHFKLPKIVENVRDTRKIAFGKLREVRESIRDAIEEKPSLELAGNVQENLMRYRGRPLEGIWATAPYLHNGSVPNLDELLMPADKRSTKFQVGSREFDPTHVGFRTDKGFLFDTSLPGNSNRGHEYGVAEMKDDQKRAALLEYLKSL